MAKAQKQMSHKAIWLGLALTLALFQLTSAQNYHFSNGWHPGKKRASTAMDSSTGTVVDSTCVFRPDLLEIINKLIQDELSRIQTSCVFGLSRGLRELLEIQGVSSKLDNDKW